MSQNAPVTTLPKGIPNQVDSPSGNDWIMIQEDANNRIGKTQLKDLGGIAGGVESFNTRTGAVTLEAADVAPFAPPLGTGTTVAVAGAATLNETSGSVTSEALSTATTYTLTLTNSLITASSIVLVNVFESTHAAGVAIVNKTVTAHQIVIAVTMASLTGTLQFDFAVFN